MKKLNVMLLVVLSLCLIGVLSVPAMGQDGRGRDANLTDEQKAEIAKIRQDSMEQIRSVLTADQLEQLQQMRTENTVPDSDKPGKGKGLKGDGKGTKGQGMKGEGKGPRGMRGDKGCGIGFMGSLAKLNLTEEQQAQIDKIHQAAWEEVMNAETREDKQAVFQKLHEDMLAVLTDEQRAQLKQRKEDGKGPHGPRPDMMGPMAGPQGPGGPGMGFGMMQMFDKLNLTDEQKAKIEQLHKTAREEAAATEEPEAKRAIFQKLRLDVRAVMTAEQQEQLDQMREEGMKRMAEHGMKGPGMGPMAGPQGPGARLARGAGLMQYLDKLELTEEQKAKIAEIRKETRTKIQAIRAQDEQN